MGFFSVREPDGTESDFDLWAQILESDEMPSRFEADRVRVKGGAGSGNFGHAGRPGEVGGSAPSGGGGADFVSPNVEEHLSLSEAMAAVHSERQQALAKEFQRIDALVGAEDAETTDAIGAWADGAENSTVTEYGQGISYETIRASASMKGWIAKQKAVLAFKNDPDGKHVLLKANVKGSLSAVHDDLLNAGVGFHTLIDNRDGTVGIRVFDDSDNGDVATKFGAYQGAHHATGQQFVKGTGEFIGSWDSREEGRAAYEAELGRYLSRAGNDRVAREWERIRDHWRAKAAALSAALLKYSPDQPRDDHGRFSDEDGASHTVTDRARHRERIRLAKETYKPSTREKQRMGKKSVEEISALVGGDATPDHEAMDVIVQTAHRQIGIEVKTLLDNSNDKITMHPKSLARKQAWVRRHKAEGHTIVVDRRGSKLKYYHRDGFGSFRISAMTEISEAEVHRYVREKAMSYYLYDARGYLADGPSVGGMNDFAEWADRAGLVAINELVETGSTEDISGLVNALASAKASDGMVDRTRIAMLAAARQAHEILILSDGIGLESETRSLKYAPEKGGPGSGNFGHAGRPGEVGGSSSDGSPAVMRRPSSSFSPVNAQGIHTQERFSTVDASGKRVYTPEREALHKAIEDKYFADARPAVGDPVLMVMGGGPASGKSSIDVPFPDHAVRIDPDEIRQLLPEYRENIQGHAPGYVGVAGYTHEEASDIATRIRERAGRERTNVILDGTGDSKIGKLEDRVKGFRASGYRVEAHYVTIDTDEAVSRMVARGKAMEARGQVGRFVGESTLRDLHKNVSKVFPEAIRRGLFDVATVWDNNVAKGEKPILIAKSKGRSLSVVRPDRWQKFLDKGRD